jgi:hypothetical protein
LSTAVSSMKTPMLPGKTVQCPTLAGVPGFARAVPPATTQLNSRTPLSEQGNTFMGGAYPSQTMIDFFSGSFRGFPIRAMEPCYE